MLAPWLTIKQHFVEAALIGGNLFAVARFTKRLMPVLAEHHRSAWDKIRAANQK